MFLYIQLFNLLILTTAGIELEWTIDVSHFIDNSQFNDNLKQLKSYTWSDRTPQNEGLEDIPRITAPAARTRATNKKHKKRHTTPTSTKLERGTTKKALGRNAHHHQHEKQKKHLKRERDEPQSNHQRKKKKQIQQLVDNFQTQNPHKKKHTRYTHTTKKENLRYGPKIHKIRHGHVTIPTFGDVVPPFTVEVTIPDFNGFSDAVNTAKDKAVNVFTNHTHEIINKTSENLLLFKNQSMAVEDDLNKYINQTHEHIHDHLDNIKNHTHDSLDQISDIKNETVSDFLTVSHIKNKTEGQIHDHLDKLHNHTHDSHDHISHIKNETEGHIHDHLDQLQNHTHDAHDHISHIKNETEHHVHDHVSQIKNETESEIQDNVDKLKNHTNDALGDLDAIKNITEDIPNGFLNKLKNHTNQIHDSVSQITNQTQDHVNDNIDKLQNYTDNIQDHVSQIQNQTLDYFTNITDQLGEEGDKLNNYKDKDQDSDKFKDLTFGNKYKKHDKGFANGGKKLNASLHKWQSESSKVKDDEKVNKFTKHILAHTMRLFESVRSRTKEEYWKNGFKYAADTYEHRMKDFLRSTSHQEIKTVHGKQKVVLNTIEVSHLFVNRLMNMIKDDLDKRGLLRNDLSQQHLDQEVRREVDWELKKACRELGICRTKDGLLEMVVDVLTNLIKLDDDKFTVGFKSMIEAGQALDFSRTLGKKTNDGFKNKIGLVAKQDPAIQRVMTQIVKNIVASRHSPLVIYSDSNPIECNLNTTISFLEILDTLDEKVPNNQFNSRKWQTIRNEMRNWEPHGSGIKETMVLFVEHIKHVMDYVDGKSWKIIKEHAKVLMS